MSLLPSRLQVSSSPDEPKVLDIDGEEADAAFEVLRSETARAVLAAVYEDPSPPTAIQDAVGTSLQNVHYHVDRLEDAGLVEPAGTGYSEKGNEMTVYAPASEAVVLFAGDDDDGDRLRDHVERLFGLAAVVAVATLAFAVVSEWLSEEPEPGPETLATDDAPGALDATTTAATTVDPVVAFLLGAATVAAVVLVWWALRPRLRSTTPSR